MTQVMVKSLPNGKVPFAEVKDSTVRETIMRMVENQVSLAERCKLLERAGMELQRTRR